MREIAVVGLGWWGGRLVESVQGRSDRVRFRRAVVRSLERSGEAARKLGLEPTADLAAVLADPAVAGVVFATPHSQHARQAAQAAAANKPVFVEKPLALDFASAAAALAACRAAKVPLAVGFNRRFLPAARAALEAVRAGRIGTALHLEAHFSSPTGHRFDAGSWRAGPGESPAGGMAGLGVHAIDLMIALAGRVGRVRATSRRRVLRRLDDTTTVFLEFDNGMTATLVMLTVAPYLWNFRVSGSAGRVEMADEHRVIETGLDNVARETRFPPVDIERLEIEAFAETIGGAPYPVPAEDAVHGAGVFEAVVRSASEGGAVVEVPQ